MFYEKIRFEKSCRGGGYHDGLVRSFSGGCFEMPRCKKSKRRSLLRLEEFGLYKKIVDVLSLFKRNILISPLEGEKKFLSELCELRNFREGYNLKNSCPVQHETVFNPSPAFVMLTGVRKRLLPLTKREGINSVISNNFSDTAFSRFTSHFSLKRTAFTLAEGATHVAHCKDFRKVAFTLAEVLITLGIIGIVAALTLPTLISNYKEKAFVVAAKKNYSVLTNAINKWNEDNGVVGDASAFWQSEATDDDLTLALSKELNATKVCTYAKLKECGGAYDILQYKKMNDGSGNTTQENWISQRARIILADGTFVSLQPGKIYNTNCERVLWANDKDQNGNFTEDSTSPSGFKGHYLTHNVCGRLAFDTNGLKGPNQIGVDVFQIPYMGNGQIGTNNDSWGNINYILANDKLIKTEKYKIGKFE